ncbi:hypothetical protein AA14362_1576 [Acetobacter cerevisiae DSM 14362]|nr:hypothetical protein AA14362_1576 [Acetobacter cerevisiae DSM 14362]
MAVQAEWLPELVDGRALPAWHCLRVLWCWQQELVWFAVQP